MMVKNRILIIHAGDMDNKGSDALLRSDVSIINQLLGDNVELSVSAIGVQRIKESNLPFKHVLPTVADVPYRTADGFARRLGIARNTKRYKVLAIASLIYMFFQTLLAIFSAILTKIGLGALYRGEFFSYMKNCDLVVSCSDENYKEAASLLPTNLSWTITWWTYIFYRTLEISIAKFLNKPIIMFPNSIGPFRTVIGRFMTRLSLNNCSYVLVREPFSYEIVKSLNIGSRIIQTADIALLYKSALSTSESFSHPVLGVCPGVYSSSLTVEQVNKYISEHAAVLDSSIEEHGFDVVLSPHYVSNLEYDDLEICNLIAREMKNKGRVKIVVAENVEDYKSILDQMDMVMVSKMHAGVLAISGYVPTLSLAYDHKQTGLFAQLSMKNCILPITEASRERLAEKIRYIWKDKEHIRDSLRKRVPELQEITVQGVKEALGAFVRISS